MPGFLPRIEDLPGPQPKHFMVSKEGKAAIRRAFEAAQRYQLRQLGFEAHFAARLALIEHPDVRLCVRDHPERRDLIDVFAELNGERQVVLDAPTNGPTVTTNVRVEDPPTVVMRWTVSMAHAYDRQALRWQAEQLAALFDQRPGPRPGAGAYVAERIR